jgi:hypothetical protein
MKVYADMHIHSCLSPCGSEDMTPNNIVNMALIKGLNMIAVTDHNTARNLPAVCAVGREAGLCVVPGIELNTAEDVHMLAYFPDVESALAFGEHIRRYLPPVPLNARFFGEQTVMNEEDEPVGSEEYLLISPLNEDIGTLADEVRAFGGVSVPAHIDHASHGAISVLGFLNPRWDFTAVEVSRKGVAEGFAQYDPRLVRLVSSDAHDLGAILERESFYELDECSTEDFLRFLKKK